MAFRGAVAYGDRRDAVADEGVDVDQLGVGVLIDVRHGLGDQEFRRVREVVQVVGLEECGDRVAADPRALGELGALKR
ncbi:hypothetical protein SVIO_041350 [Streptomyces violaceusniger]|uniref:Uncharacterized protein n=1 Tax=Streptomyces violaceusniger TaxID=68280 RepID=A0A4D4KXH3_STRVO|nr:hypothetical protein SVIO_041350 [Streptomyces violaceusniger]